MFLVLHAYRCPFPLPRAIPLETRPLPPLVPGTFEPRRADVFEGGGGELFLAGSRTNDVSVVLGHY